MLKIDIFYESVILDIKGTVYSFIGHSSYYSNTRVSILRITGIFSLIIEGKATTGRSGSKLDPIAYVIYV